MTKIFLSNTSEKASQLLLEHLKVEREKGGQHVLIVPDRFALSAERNVMKALGTGALFDVEIMSFTRLARRVLSDSLRKGLSPEGAVMLMRRAIDDVRDKLDAYYSAAATPGFAGEMFAVLGAIRNNDIDAERIRVASYMMKGPSARKAKDIATIFERYEELLASEYDDMTSRLNSLAWEIEESAEVATTNYYVMEFNTFTTVQRRIISGLGACARSLTVASTTARWNVNARALSVDQSNRLISAVTYKDDTPEVVYARDSLSPRQEKTLSELYSYEATSQENTEEVKLYCAKDQREEVVNLASYIRHLVVDGGYRYRDVAVVCQSEELKRLIKEIFPLYDVAYFADVKESVMSHAGARFIVDWLKVQTFGISLENVLTFMKNPYFPCAREDVDRFENYCLKLSIDRRGMAKPFEYEWDGKEGAERARVALLGAISRGARDGTVRDIIASIRDMMERTGWRERCESFMTEQSEAGDTEGAGVTAQIAERVDLLLVEMEEIMGDVKTSVKQFTGLLESMLTESKISLIPFYQDCVYVGDTKDSRYSGVKALFLIGALDGEIPTVGRESGILSEAELTSYRRVGVNIDPNGVTAFREEKANIASILAKPTDLLYVSCSLGAGKEGKKPSSLFAELNRLFGVEIMGEEAFKVRHPEIYLHRFTTKRGAEAQLATLPQGEHEKLRELFDMTGEGKPLTRKRVAVTSENKLFRHGTTKVSQLESYFTCPFRHFLQYVLKLRERQEGLEAVDFGTIVHAVLEHFFKECDFGKKDDECLKVGLAIADRILDEEYPYLEEGSPERIDLMRDVEAILKDVIERQRHTDFEPRFFEAKIGMDGADFDGVDVAGLNLVGVVDRIDCYGDRVAVFDYKTGSPEGKLIEVYYGQKIQLYAYLNSIVKKGYKPAGVFYYPVNTKYDNDNSKRRTLKGQVLNDLTTAMHLDRTIYPNETGRFIPIRPDKKGNIKNGLSDEEFKGVMAYALNVSAQAVKEIREGYIAPSPAGTDPCKWCPYSSMCPTSVGARKLSTIGKELFLGEEKNEQ